MEIGAKSQQFQWLPIQKIHALAQSNFQTIGLSQYSFYRLLAHVEIDPAGRVHLLVNNSGVATYKHTTHYHGYNGAAFINTGAYVNNDTKFLLNPVDLKSFSMDIVIEPVYGGGTNIIGHIFAKNADNTNWYQIEIGGYFSGVALANLNLVPSAGTLLIYGLLMKAPWEAI